MHTAYLTALLGATITAAAPSIESRTTRTETAMFDDLTPIPGVAISPVGASGFYQNVYWPGFALINTDADGKPDGKILGLIRPPGVELSSKPNGIAWGTTDIQTVLNGPARIDTERSKIKTIDLQSFYAGCVTATKASLGAVPFSCDLAVTCHRADGKKVGPQVFRYNAGLLQLFTARLKEFTPKGFTGCTSVVFDNPKAVGALEVGAVLAGVADDVTLVKRS
ncbi:MAG: hypothetical protein Q9169_003080 [Polycauliona sp. 2 TL-2023]